jgi:CDP-glucose 4,6-dehydratase
VKIPAPVLIDPDFWQDRRVLITGHTGFKGSWLSLWLRSMGATVTGISRGVPTRPSLYELAGAGAGVSEIAADLRDGAGMRDALAHARPEVVLHLAAQPMVRRSISEPALTYEVNVMGTVNVLEAVRDLGDMVRAVVLVTTDRCYENTAAEPRRFVESDRLGGSDPYSSSKAAAELVAAAYRRTYFEGPDTARVASARTGNVIGGGDWGQDRLLPDIMRAAGSGEPVRVHNPSAVRPWQHVLNPLSGYLLLAQELCRDAGAARAWNFGPAAQDERTVGWIVERLAELWDGELLWEVDEGENPPEAAHLAVDSTLAERALGWRPAWDLDEALTRLVEWHRAQLRGEQMRAVTLGQIESFAAATPPA